VEYYYNTKQTKHWLNDFNTKEAAAQLPMTNI